MLEDTACAISAKVLGAAVTSSSHKVSLVLLGVPYVRTMTLLSLAVWLPLIFPYEFLQRLY